MKRANHRIRTILPWIAVASLGIGGSATAQIPPIIELPPGLPTVMPNLPGGYPQSVAPTAAGPYLASPGWDQTIAPNLRFVILSNFNHDAVLDRETGLVWTRRTVMTDAPAYFAVEACRRLTIGNRLGWRLPTVAELQSLVDASLPPTQGQLRLPVGHPFVVLDAGFPGTFGYWASETARQSGFTFREYVHLSTGSGTFNFISNSDVRSGVLCVRGAHGPQPFRSDDE